MLGQDLRNYVHESLSTDNCKEIVFVVVPGPGPDALCVDAPVEYNLFEPVGSGFVGHLITIHTLEIDDTRW